MRAHIFLLALAFSPPAFAQFGGGGGDPRFQAFAPAPFGADAFRREMAGFADLGGLGFGVPQFPAFADAPSPLSGGGRMGFVGAAGPPAQPMMAPYGSPLFGGSNMPADGLFGGDPLEFMQQPSGGGYSLPIQHQRASALAQPSSPSLMAAAGSMMHGGPLMDGGAGLPPPFASLPPPSFGHSRHRMQMLMAPVGGRPPFQRTPGQEVGGGGGVSSAGQGGGELEPFQTLPSASSSSSAGGDPSELPANRKRSAI